MPQKEKDEDFPIGLSCAFDCFMDLEEVMKHITGLRNPSITTVQIESSYYRFLTLIDRYQEQPHLMDPHLENMFSHVLSTALDNSLKQDVRTLAFKFMYIICKCRGAKHVIRLLPHEVGDLPRALDLLANQDMNEGETFEVRYVLLLWLSIIIMIPFDMNRFDGAVLTDNGDSSTALRFMQLVRRYLSSTDKCCEAASLLLARFLTRHDMKSTQLPIFFDWALGIMDPTTFRKRDSYFYGILKCLASIFKIGKRQDLLPYACRTLKCMQGFNLLHFEDVVVRKVTCKLYQRIALTFLRSRVAAWRYFRGSRSLTDNLSQTKSASVAKVENCEDDEFDDVCEEVETILGDLLSASIKDRDTIVRWSAAKGIGRITGRLPADLADDIINCLMEYFNPLEQNGTWHGCCLALAELGRRGLLLPRKLPMVLNVLLKAFQFEEDRGAFSVGSNVRDAACYVAWSLARAFEPDVLKPYVKDLASGLIQVFLFDKEVNCRRAASAAFQENVGRQGTFPHGIEILTTADYFAVGNLNNCYLNLSVYICGFEEYLKDILNHLREYRICHWDLNIRKLAASACSRLVVKAPEYIANEFLTQLTDMFLHRELNSRHGSILTTSHIVASLVTNGYSKLITGKVKDALENVAIKLTDAGFLKGIGGEVLKVALSSYILNIAVTKFPLSQAAQTSFFNFLLENHKYVKLEVQESVCEPFKILLSNYFVGDEGGSFKILHEIFAGVIPYSTSTKEYERMGSARILGYLPVSYLGLPGAFERVLGTLQSLSRIGDNSTESFADARVSTLNSFAKILSCLKDENATDLLTKANMKIIMDCMLSLIKDYTVDKRGDIGVIVRESSMQNILHVFKLFPDFEYEDHVVMTYVNHLVLHLVAKINRTRAVAFIAIINVLYRSPSSITSRITDFGKLKDVFAPISELNDEIVRNLRAESFTFPLIDKLIEIESYNYYLLEGLVQVMGGLTESLVFVSSEVVRTYCAKLIANTAKFKAFFDVYCKILENNVKNVRISFPFLKATCILLQDGLLDQIVEKPEGDAIISELIRLVRLEVKATCDYKRLHAAMSVLSALLQYASTGRTQCLLQFALFLCHRYPRIRICASEQLYEALLVSSDFVKEERSEELEELLTCTDWVNNSVDDLRTVRNTICDLLEIPRPVLKK